MSLCALIYSKIRRITSVDDMIQIMTIGNELYSSLSLLARQSMLMFTELPGIVTVFERFFQLQYSESYTCNINGDARIEGYNYCMPLGTALETLLAMNYNAFILTVGIIGVGIYSIEGGEYKVFDSHARDMYGNSHSQGTCVLLEIPSLQKLVQYFQSLYRKEDIYELKGVHIANFEVDVCSSRVEDCSISNVNSYQCSCKQCCAIAIYAMCYSVINPCGYWTSGTLSALVSNGNKLYNVMGVKRHIMAADLPESVSISGAEIKVTVCGISNGVLCYNLAESKSLLKMCISKHCHEVTGFLLWIGTYCISCVVQQTIRIKDLFSLVGYDDSCVGEITHVKSIKGVQSLVEEICKVTESKLNFESVRYEIQFLLCSCNIESSERKKIARKHRYSSFEYCEMEPVKKKVTFSYKEKRNKADRGIDFCIEQFRNKIREGPCYICCVCNRLLYGDQLSFFAKVNICV